MDKSYIFKTADEKDEIVLYGNIGIKKMEALQRKFVVKVMAGAMVSTINTPFLNIADLIKEVE